MDKILEFCKNNKKLVRICAVIILAIVILCAIPIRGCIRTNSMANDYYDSAVTEKAAGEYISAYYDCQQALDIKPNMKKALELMEELTPLKEQQEAEEQAQDEAEQAAEEAEKQEAIQTLLSQYEFDGELAVKILEEYTGLNSGVFMYGEMSYDAKGNYFPVLHAYGYNEYWSRWFVYETGEVISQDGVQSYQGYTVSTETTVHMTSTPETKPTLAPTTAPAITKEPVTQSVQSQSKVLDMVYYGDGYKISYPSTYEKTEFGGTVMFMDPESGCNVTAMVGYDVGSIDGLTQQDISDILSAAGLNVNISIFNNTVLDGYTCYVAEYTVNGEDMMQTLFFIGDGTNTYSVTCTYSPDTSDDIKTTLTDIVYSFDIV